MSDFFNAFEVSPVPPPGPDAVAPEPYRGIYGMPQFLTVPTTDMAASTDFWTHGLGFFDLFSTPGQVTHLRRWMFQDVLLVAADAAASETVAWSTPISVSFSCVLNQIDEIAAACRAIVPDSVQGPYDTYWNTRDIAVTTPERARVIFTAAKEYEPGSEAAHNLDSMGIPAPDGAESAQ
ncbi:hypothetical protein FB381_2683 [Nocardioides albertanoniae]|uniref:VOC domain-containing protein n=1 Tax=Nocardioides albertanoniae TaxID=1175486 RepID=A0A543A8H0_9ACTN|nr:VOC family protein [Nocardioides albertanoniae]TQL68786.1 hypothetical protein FB381_2683 [Nocardioides albertanoniae]